MEEFFARIYTYKIVFDIFDALIGIGLCFGALKWRRGLLTATAIFWGAFLGAIIGYVMSDYDYNPVIIGLIIGAIIFPILTYSIAGVNRFVLGFIVATKLTVMFTTVMARNGSMEIISALTTPFIVGTIVGLILMAWTQVSVSVFVGACAFLGASQIAPTITNYIQQFLFGITGDLSYFLDPLDIIFGLMKIQLTDTWTLIIMLILMPLGIYIQLKSVKDQGYSLNTPIITYENM